MDVLMLGMATGVLVVLALKLPLTDRSPDGVFALTAGVMTFFVVRTFTQFGGPLPVWLAGMTWVPALVVRTARGTRQFGWVGWNPFKPPGAGGRSPSHD